MLQDNVACDAVLNLIKLYTAGENDPGNLDTDNDRNS